MPVSCWVVIVKTVLVDTSSCECCQLWRVRQAFGHIYKTLCWRWTGKCQLAMNLATYTHILFNIAVFRLLVGYSCWIFAVWHYVFCTYLLLCEIIDFHCHPDQKHWNTSTNCWDIYVKKELCAAITFVSLTTYVYMLLLCVQPPYYYYSMLLTPFFTALQLI